MVHIGAIGLHGLHGFLLFIDLLFFSIDEVNTASLLVRAVPREVSLLATIEAGQVHRRPSCLRGASTGRSSTTSSVVWGPSAAKVHRDRHIVHPARSISGRVLGHLQSMRSKLLLLLVVPSSSILVALVVEWTALSRSLAEAGKSRGVSRCHFLCYGFQSLLGSDRVYGAFLGLCICGGAGASHDFLEYVNREPFQKEFRSFWASLGISSQPGQVFEL